MGAEVYAVDVDVLLQHAGRVDDVAASVDLAVDAVGQVDLAGGAFGVMCAFMVLPASLACGAGQLVMAAASRMVGRAGDRLRDWAADAQEVESENVGAINQLGTELGIR